MAPYYDSDDHLHNEDDYLDENYEDDLESYHEESDGDSLYCTAQDIVAQELMAIQRPPLIWKNIKLGQTILEVSSYGSIKPFKGLANSSEGFVLPGTPYRTYTIDYGFGDKREHYVHDLVWMAFKGPIPNGWTVRHKIRTSASKYQSRLYSNALHYLDITPDTVTKPSISMITIST